MIPLVAVLPRLMDVEIHGCAVAVGQMAGNRPRRFFPPLCSIRRES
jgi:hypothetical protein